MGRRAATKATEGMTLLHSVCVTKMTAHVEVVLTDDRMGG